jgi:zinc transporter ZupT
MMDELIYGMVTASATVAGGLWVARRPSRWLTAERQLTLVAMGAGLLLATLCVELLPESFEHGGPRAAWAMLAGVLTVMAFERYLAPRLSMFDTPAACCAHDHHDHHDHGEVVHLHAHDGVLGREGACTALGCLLVCTFFDGVAIAASFGVSVQVGLLVGLGLVLHLIPEGLLAAVVVRAAGYTPRRAAQAAFAVGAALLAGMVATRVLGGALGALEAALPFAAGVIMHVLTSQLMPAAQRLRHGLPLLAGMAVLFAALEGLLPHTH